MAKRITDENYLVHQGLQLIDAMPGLLDQVAEHAPHIDCQPVSTIVDNIREHLRPSRRPTSPRAMKIFSYAREYNDIYGITPSAKQIARRFGLKYSFIVRVLRRLHEEGYIIFRRNGSFELIDFEADDPILERIDRLERDNARLKTAVLDAIRKPAGVVPLSAEPFVPLYNNWPRWFRRESDLCYPTTKSPPLTVRNAGAPEPSKSTSPGTTTGNPASRTLPAPPAEAPAASTNPWTSFLSV